MAQHMIGVCMHDKKRKKSGPECMTGIEGDKAILCLEFELVLGSSHAVDSSSL